MGSSKLRGARFLVETSIKADQANVILHALNNGTFLAVWDDESRTIHENVDICGQIYNADGTKSGGEFVINSAVRDTQVHPKVTVLADGRFVVTWEDVNQDPAPRVGERRRETALVRRTVRRIFPTDMKRYKVIFRRIPILGGEVDR